jgi:hypothetical protein
MPTPARAEYLEAIGSGGTLLLGSDAIWCGDWKQILSVGPSRGENLPVSDMDGTEARDRDRGELSVTLKRITIDGRFDQDNNPVTTGQRENLLALMRIVANFWDDFCTGRRFTIRLTDPTGVSETSAQFEELGDWRDVGPLVSEVDALITLNFGRLGDPSS